MGIRYKLGAGGMQPYADSPADAAGRCDCSGFACWALGFARIGKDPFYLRVAGGWINTDSMLADARNAGGLLDLVSPIDARPGDLYVFGKGGGRRYGHVGVVSAVARGRVTRVIHCSPLNEEMGLSAIAETGPAVFEKFGGVIARYSALEDDSEAPPLGAEVLRGKMSTFGGPDDKGVTPSEGLALIEPKHLADHRLAALFLERQPPGTSGLARRLNPDRYYIACRWSYDRTPKDWLRKAFVLVTNPKTGTRLMARAVDWGPNARTGRVADLSPGLAAALGLKTDDDVLVTVPLPAAKE